MRILGPMRFPIRPGRTVTVLTGALAALALCVGTASAVTVPTEFGTDYHDPVTAAPAVFTPHTKSCSVTVAEAKFKDFTPYTGTYTPPTGCGTPAAGPRSCCVWTGT